jgi:CheY-like chemotaxis protein
MFERDRMLRILIVDDDAQKVRRVAEAISALPGVDPDAIDVANTARDARVRLTSTAYDLLILDVALPERADLPPAADVGIALLKEVCSRGRYVNLLQ